VKSRSPEGNAAPASRSLPRSPDSGGLRCLVSYRALASLAEDTRDGQPPQAEIQAISAILDRLQAAAH
jgi:hypothetical protein